MLYRPEYILFLGFVTYFVLWVVAPLQPTVEISGGAIFFIFLCAAAFVLGSQFANRIRLRQKWKSTARNLVGRMENRLFWLMFTIGGTGLFLRFFDKYVLRGVGSLTGSAAREILLESNASPLSLLSGVLYPFAYIPLFIYLGSSSIGKSRMKFIGAAVLFLLPSIDALITFSRSFMLVSMAMMYFGVSITIFKGRALPRQLLIPLVVGGAAAVSSSAAIFLLRLEDMQFDVTDSVFLSGYAYTLQPNQFTWELISGHSATATVLAALLPILQYFLHSLYEFQILWSSPSQQIFSYGALTFAPYVKALSIFGLAENANLFELFPRVGIFTTFFGPLWVDFGYFSPLVMFVFGFMARRLARAARGGDLGAYPLYTYFCVVLFFAPVVNFLISAQGMYNINAFVVFWLMSRKLARRVVESDAD